METVQIEAPPSVAYEASSGRAERVDINKLLPLIKLRGEGYNPIKKAHIYCQVAHRVRGKKLTIGDQFHDMRIHVDTALHMGGGKGKIKEFHELWTPNEHIDASGSIISPSYLSPTDIWKEQLVGKVDKYVTKKGEVRIDKVPGYLCDANLLVFDEAIPLWTENIHTASRSDIRQAKDPMMSNKILKKNTNIRVQDRLEYYPDCTILLFIQDSGWRGRPMLPCDLIKKGDLRRDIVVYRRFTEGERLEAFSEDETPIDDSEAKELWREILSNADKVNEIARGFSPKDRRDPLCIEDKHYLRKRVSELHQIGIEAVGNAKEFTLGALWDIMFYLARFSLVQAIMNGRYKATNDDIDAAFKDYREIWASQINFLNVMVEPLPSKGMPPDEVNALLRLSELLSGSGKNVTKTRFIEVLKSHGSGSPDALYRRLVSKGYVEGVQDGQYSKLIWLTNLGKEAIKLNEPNEAYEAND